MADRHGAFLVGEVYVMDPNALAAYVDGERLHSSFWFGLLEAADCPAPKTPRADFACSRQAQREDARTIAVARTEPSIRVQDSPGNAVTRNQ